MKDVALVDKRNLEAAKWFALLAFAFVGFCGFVTALAVVAEWDFGGYKKAAYDEGYRAGLGKPKPGERETSYRVWGCRISEENNTATVCLVTLADNPPAPMELISIHPQDVREAYKLRAGSIFKLTRYGAEFE